MASIAIIRATYRFRGSNQKVISCTLNRANWIILKKNIGKVLAELSQRFRATRRRCQFSCVLRKSMVLEAEHALHEISRWTLATFKQNLLKRPRCFRDTCSILWVAITDIEVSSNPWGRNYRQGRCESVCGCTGAQYIPGEVKAERTA